MTEDTPPQDEEIIAAIAEADGGLTPSELIAVFATQDYSEGDVIIALQRVFDRGMVELANGAKLITAEVQESMVA